MAGGYKTTTTTLELIKATSNTALKDRRSSSKLFIELILCLIAFTYIVKFIDDLKYEVIIENYGV